MNETPTQQAAALSAASAKPAGRSKSKRILWASLIVLAALAFFLYVPILEPLKLKVTGTGDIWQANQYLDLAAVGEKTSTDLPPFYFTTVDSMEISTLNDYACALLYYGEPEIKPIVPSGSKPEINYTFNDMDQLLRYSTLSSAQNLTLYALQSAGRDVPHTVEPTVTVIYDAFETGKAFRGGDRVIEVDGRPVHSSADFVAAIQAKAPVLGTSLQIKVIRDNKEVDVPVTYRETSNSGKPIIGIRVNDVFRFDGIDPMKLLKFDNGIEGNSAGLMLALQLTEELTGKDMTKGYKIAGTGTLEQNGSVGEIGAAAHKVKTADSFGVDIFFVPKSDAPEEKNESEATAALKELNTTMRVVPVSTLDEAIRYLNELPAKAKP